MIYTLKNAFIEVKINSYGAEVVSAKGFGGYEFIWSGEAWRDHAPLLFPTCGRLLEGKYSYDGVEYPLSAHGFAKKSEFSSLESTDTSLTLSLKADEQTKAVYPFCFELIAEYSIDQNVLTAKFTVINRDVKVMPYMFGWHPGFTLGGDCQINDFYLDFGLKHSLSLHPLQNGCFVNPTARNYPLNNGKYYIDDDELAAVDTLIFCNTNECVTLNSANFDRSIDFSWSDNLPYFCVWKAPGKDIRFICLEPWSDVPADGITPENFNDRKMSRLDPTKQSTYSYKIKFN